jgi:UDP-N-acetylmuramyl pentapeptide phosphotransferase/UDP-N-acetylglucosamine-1-phosphate transferase
MNHANHNLISAKANVSVANVKRLWRGRSQNHSVRFWIITMMLVLVGLSTLKLR